MNKPIFIFLFFSLLLSGCLLTRRVRVPQTHLIPSEQTIVEAVQIYCKENNLNVAHYGSWFVVESVQAEVNLIVYRDGYISQEKFNQIIREICNQIPKEAQNDKR